MKSAMKRMKTLRCAAVIGAAALLLTGCAKETNLSDRYGEFFKYTFGDDYQFTFARNESDGNHARDYYNLTYRGLSGVMGTREFEIIPYSDGDYSEDFSKEAYYQYQLEELIQEEIIDNGQQQFFDQLLKPNVTKAKQGEISTKLGENGDDGWMIVFPSMLCWTYDEDEASQAVARQMLEAGTGIQVSKTDLKAVLEDERFFLAVSVYLDPEADISDYEQRMRAVLDEMKQITDKPQNYSFVVKQNAPEGSGESGKIIIQEYCILGEQVDYDERKAAYDAKKEDDDIDGYSIRRDARDCLLAKYRNS